MDFNSVFASRNAIKEQESIYKYFQYTRNFGLKNLCGLKPSTAVNEQNNLYKSTYYFCYMHCTIWMEHWLKISYAIIFSVQSKMCVYYFV